MLLYLVWFINSTFFSILKFNNTVTFFFFWLLCAVCGILVLWSRIEPVPPVFESQCPNQWTTGNSQYFYLYDILPFYIFTYFFLTSWIESLVYQFLSSWTLKIYSQHVWYNRQFYIDGIMSHMDIFSLPSVRSYLCISTASLCLFLLIEHLRLEVYPFK